MFMPPYKFVDIPNFDKIQQDLVAMVPSFFKEVSTHAVVVNVEDIKLHCPLLIDFFEKNNLVWDIARFFMIAPMTEIRIHIDGNSENPKFLALNLPVMGYKNTNMNWWDQVELCGVESTEKYGKNIGYYDSDNKVMTHTVELNSPALVQIDIPHNVNNPHDCARVVLSVRFKPEPTELWYK